MGHVNPNRPSQPVNSMSVTVKNSKLLYFLYGMICSSFLIAVGNFGMFVLTSTDKVTQVTLPPKSAKAVDKKTIAYKFIAEAKAKRKVYIQELDNDMYAELLEDIKQRIIRNPNVTSYEKCDYGNHYRNNSKDAHSKLRKKLIQEGFQTVDSSTDRIDCFKVILE